MASYSISSTLLKAVLAEKSYICKILFHFANENEHKVSIDESGKVLNLYQKIAEKEHIIFTWIDLMAKQPPIYFETIKVNIDDSIREEEIFLKLCKNTKMDKKLLINSHQEWELFDYKYKNCIEYENIDIEVYDKDEAITELHPKNYGDTINVKNSNFVNKGGKVSKSKTENK